MINIIDKINEFILEMTFKRKDVIFKIQNFQFPINLHLVKLLKFDDKQNYNKHLNDVHGWFIDIQSLKVRTNKRLTSKKYFDILFQEPFTNRNDVESITNIVKRRLQNYKNLPVIRSDQEVLNLIYDIHKKASKLISLNALNDFKKDIWDKIK